MSLLDDIQTVGSRMAGFFDERENGQRPSEPSIPSSINVQDVATFFNPNLALVDAALTGNVTPEAMAKYKEAKGIKDLFDIAGQASYTKPGEAPGQAITRALSAPSRMDPALLQSIAAQKTANVKMLEQMAELAPPEVVTRAPTIEEQKQDSLVPEAFGLVDATQMAFAKVGSAVGIKDLESNKALAAREELNRTILSIGADLFSGRPSKFLLEQIQKTIPVNALEGDDIAYQKYVKLKNTFRSQVPQFERLLAGADTATKKSEYAQKLADLKYMVDRLDVVTGAFEQGGYGQEAFYKDPDMLAGEFTQQDLDELTNYFKE